MTIKLDNVVEVLMNANFLEITYMRKYYIAVCKT